MTTPSHEPGTPMWLDSEAIVLNILMYAPDSHAVSVVLDGLHPHDFFRPTYGAIFEAISSHHNQELPRDPAAISASVLHMAGDLNRESVNEALIEVSMIPTRPRFPPYLSMQPRF